MMEKGENRLRAAWGGLRFALSPVLFLGESKQHQNLDRLRYRYADQVSVLHRPRSESFKYLNLAIEKNGLRLTGQGGRGLDLWG
jgi:hypothetical protein